MLDVWYFWQERLESMVMAGGSPWFDDQSTAAKEKMDDIFVRAAREVLKERKGDPGLWRWGDEHRLVLVSPIMREGALKGIFGGGSQPMGGSGETLYRSTFKYAEPFNVNISASLRMVADLSDADKVMAVLSGGVSGRLFNQHTTDQVAPFMNGGTRYWWFSDAMIKAHGMHNCTLVPDNHK
jgi:penicillin amidase